MQKLWLLTLGISLTTLTGISTAGLVTVTPLVGSHRFADDTLSPRQTINDATQYGVALSYYPASTWGWEIGLSRASTEVGLTDNLDWKSGDVSFMRRFYTYQAIQPYLLAGIGQARYHSATLATENSSYGQLGAGIMWNLNDLLALRAEVRALSLQKTSSVDYVRFLGLEFACGCMGSSYYERRHRVHAPDPIIAKASPVLLKVAESPANPPPASFPALPKPAVILDADSDGVHDDSDKCENTPAKTKVNANGCPLVVDGDDDKDGIKNSLDKCANTPANTKVDDKGCPFVKSTPNNNGNNNNGNNNGGNKSGGGSTTTSGNAGAPININVTNNNNNYNDGKLTIPNDNDQDGVTDDLDKCPSSPAKSKVDAKGCPVVAPTAIVDADKDQDGVLDSVDKCLNTPKGAKVDATGCTLALTEDIAINLHVLFETDKAIIINKAMTDIQKVAEFMRNYPDVTMTVEGHTDDRASAQHNLLLSKKRAQAVKRELVKAGISASRLRAVGYGESQPIADNATEEGRGQNRRVVATAKYKK
ncbi:OmpA family protein [Moraxellaceae bacterium AER2_44_116]|nr:OmpA family protein [Moraxellaceae bacterium]TQC96793.1 OmpA family protein [Moraxellaceae bacterium AER2_44_116]